MKDVWPEFADKVDFYAIGQSRFESIEQLESDRRKEGYPWPIAEIDQVVLRNRGRFLITTPDPTGGKATR